MKKNELENFYLKVGFDKLNISREQLQKDLNVSQPYISNLLNGKKPIGAKTAKKLADLYNIDINWLLTGEGEMQPNEITENNQKVNLLNKKRSSYTELPIEEKLNVLYQLCLDNFINPDLDLEHNLGGDIKKVKRTIHGLVNKDAHQDRYIDFMRDKIIKLEESLEAQKLITSQILDIVKDLKLTPH